MQLGQHIRRSRCCPHRTPPATGSRWCSASRSASASTRKWDLFGEIRQAYDFEQLARSLIQDGAGDDGVWKRYAQILLATVDGMALDQDDQRSARDRSGGDSVADRAVAGPGGISKVCVTAQLVAGGAGALSREGAVFIVSRRMRPPGEAISTRTKRQAGSAPFLSGCREVRTASCEKTPRWRGR